MISVTCSATCERAVGRRTSTCRGEVTPDVRGGQYGCFSRTLPLASTRRGLRVAHPLA